MSMYLEFEPHSWYYEFAIQHRPIAGDGVPFDKKAVNTWHAFTDNGNTYNIVELHAASLKELKREIIRYWFRDGGKHVPAFYKKKLLKSKEEFGV